jgi:hypothetical protein
MKIFNINISLQQLTSWADEENLLKSMKPKRRRTITAGEMVKYLEGLYPLAVIKRCNRMIKDEAVDVNDLSITVIDESTGVEYPYEPPLDLVFG